MVGLAGRWRLWVRWALMGCGLAASMAVLQGCASHNAGLTADSNAGLITPSDEPETRRRARIRLELASNYFENGQTAVALDEVNLRGLIYMRMSDFAQADDSFRRALALRGGDPNLLHNYGWLLCQQQKYAEADQQYVRALASPAYTARSKTLMARGLCQSGAGKFVEAEDSLLKSYELDASNPVVGYNLSALLFRRNELTRAQFYIRRLNNSQFANSESLWLGIKVERALGDAVAMKQLADQLRRRFPESLELGLYERGAFNE